MGILGWLGIALAVVVTLVIVGYILSPIYFLARMAPGLVAWMATFVGVIVLAWKTGIWWLALLILPVTWLWMIFDPSD